MGNKDENSNNPFFPRIPLAQQKRKSHPKSEYQVALDLMTAAILHCGSQTGEVTIQDLLNELRLGEKWLDNAQGAMYQISHGITNMSAVMHPLFALMVSILEQYGDNPAELERLIGVAKTKIKELKSRIAMLRTIEENQEFLKHDDDNDNGGPPAFGFGPPNIGASATV